MTSTNLETLRGLPRELVEKQRAFKKQYERVRDDPYMEASVKGTKLQALAASARIALDETKADAERRATAIREKSISKPLEISDVTRQHVQAALSAGASWSDVAKLCVETKNRSGLQALREELVWQVAAHKIDPRAKDEAFSALTTMEMPLLEPAEQAAMQEAREVGACLGALQLNIKTLDTYYSDEQNPNHTGHTRPPEFLHGWFGLPGAENDPARLSLSEEVSTHA